MTLKVIETSYKGYRFRSRTEARWAVFFDSLGWQWEYEHEGFDLDGIFYLPDFWFPKFKFFVEIKGSEPTENDFNKAFKLAQKSSAPVLIISGQPEFEKITLCRVYSGPEEYDHEGNSFRRQDRIQEKLFWKHCINGCIGLGPIDPNELWIGEKCYRDVCACIDNFPLRMLLAQHAARGARFEFGEKGQVTREQTIKIFE